MDLLLWVLICLFFVVVATVWCVQALRRKEPVGRTLWRWLVNVIDIISGLATWLEKPEGRIGSPGCKTTTFFTEMDKRQAG